MSLPLPGTQAWPHQGIASPDLAPWQRRVGIGALALSLLPLALALVPGLMVPTLVPVLIILALGWWRKSGKLMRFLIGVGAAMVIALSSFAGAASSAQEMAHAYAILLISMKAMELGTSRDLRMLAVLSFVGPIITVILPGQSHGAFFGMISIPVSLALLAMACDFETGRLKGVRLGWRGVWREYAKPTLARIGVALPMAAILFWIIPRFDAPIWGQPGGSNTTGLSDSMAPGDIGELLNSPALAFRAYFDEPMLRKGPLYWRAITFSHFDGVTWQKQLAPDMQTVEMDTDERVTYDMVLEPQSVDYIPLLDTPVQILRGGVVAQPDMTARSTSSARQRRSFRAQSAPQANKPVELGTVERQLNLDLPPGFNPRTVELAQRLRAASVDEQAFIDRTLGYFSDTMTYTYEPSPVGRNFVDDMMFTTRDGYCEHFSTAFAVIMRAGGVPARIAAGYQGGAPNEETTAYTIRQYDAHAWTEVWLDGKGWVRVDPTSAVVAERPRDPQADGIAGRVAGALGLEALMMERWREWFTDFDADTQRYIARKTFNLQQRFGIPEWAGQLALAVGGVLVLACCFAMVMWYRPRNRRRVAGADALETAWQQALVRARRAGISIPDNATANTAMKAVARSVARPNSLAFSRLAVRYAQAQYQHRTSNATRLALAVAIGQWKPRPLAQVKARST